MKNKISILTLAAILSSCTNYQAESFSSNTLDVYAIQGSIKTPISIAQLSSNDPNKNSIFCRSVKNSVYLPNKITFTKYIEDALKETLINSGRYDKKSPYQLRGKMTLIDFNTTSGSWHIKGIFNLNNSIPVEIDGRYEFASAWDNDVACQNTAAALNNAVGRFIHDIITNDTLRNAIKYKDKS
jgi:hypothetical protein